MANNNKCDMCEVICMVKKDVICAGESCLYKKYFTIVCDFELFFSHYDYELLTNVLEHGDTNDPKTLSIWISTKLVDLRVMYSNEKRTRKTQPAKKNIPTSLPLPSSSIPSSSISAIGPPSIVGFDPSLSVGLSFVAQSSSMSTVGQSSSTSTVGESSSISTVGLSSSISTIGLDFIAPSSSISTVGESSSISTVGLSSTIGLDYLAPSSSISTVGLSSVCPSAPPSTSHLPTSIPVSSISAPSHDSIVTSIPTSFSNQNPPSRTSLQHSTLPASTSFHPHPAPISQHLHPSPPSSPPYHPPSASPSSTPSSSPPTSIPPPALRASTRAPAQRNTVQAQQIQVERPRTRLQVAQADQVPRTRKRKGKVPCHALCNCRRAQCLCFKRKESNNRQ